MKLKKGKVIFFVLNILLFFLFNTLNMYKGDFISGLGGRKAIICNSKLGSVSFGGSSCCYVIHIINKGRHRIFLPSCDCIVFIKWLFDGKHIFYIGKNSNKKGSNEVCYILDVKEFKERRLEDVVGEEILKNAGEMLGIREKSLLKILDYDESISYRFFSSFKKYEEGSKLVIVDKGNRRMFSIDKPINYYDISGDEKYIVYSIFPEGKAEAKEEGKVMDDLIFLYDMKIKKSYFLSKGNYPVFTRDGGIIFTKYKGKGWRFYKSSIMRYDMKERKIQEIVNPWNGKPYLIEMVTEYRTIPPSYSYLWQLTSDYNLFYLVSGEGIYSSTVLLRLDLLKGITYKVWSEEYEFVKFSIFDGEER